MGCYCIYGLSVSRGSEWSTLNGLLRCIFRVLRVSSFNGLYSAPGPFLLSFLLSLTTVNVDNIIEATLLIGTRPISHRVPIGWSSIHYYDTMIDSVSCIIDLATP